MRNRFSALRVALRRYRTGVDENKIDVVRRRGVVDRFPTVRDERRSQKLRFVLINFAPKRRRFKSHFENVPGLSVE